MSRLRPNIVPRRFLLACLVSMLTCIGARAGDLSTFRSIGHSPDGRFYAFTEHGVTDGAGAPYLTAFLIDTVEDRYVTGTPVRLGGGEPGDLSVEAIHDTLEAFKEEALERLSAAALAAGAEARNGAMDWREGDMLAFQPVTHLNADPTRVEVNRYAIPALIFEPLVLTLETVPDLPVGGDCSYAFEPVVGFRLMLGGETALNEDTRVPRSRGCPSDYRIAGVEIYRPTWNSEEVTLVTLVQVFRPGFEGPDVRWMAVVRHGALPK